MMLILYSLLEKKLCEEIVSLSLAFGQQFLQDSPTVSSCGKEVALLYMYSYQLILTKRQWLKNLPYFQTSSFEVVA